MGGGTRRRRRQEKRAKRTQSCQERGDLTVQSWRLQAWQSPQNTGWCGERPAPQAAVQAQPRKARWHPAARRQPNVFSPEYCTHTERCRAQVIGPARHTPSGTTEHEGAGYQASSTHTMRLPSPIRHWHPLPPAGHSTRLPGCQEPQPPPQDVICSPHALAHVPSMHTPR